MLDGAESVTVILLANTSQYVSGKRQSMQLTKMYNLLLKKEFF